MWQLTIKLLLISLLASAVHGARKHWRRPQARGAFNVDAYAYNKPMVNLVGQERLQRGEALPLPQLLQQLSHSSRSSLYGNQNLNLMPRNRATATDIMALPDDLELASTAATTPATAIKKQLAEKLENSHADESKMENLYSHEFHVQHQGKKKIVLLNTLSNGATAGATKKPGQEQELEQELKPDSQKVMDTQTQPLNLKLTLPALLEEEETKDQKLLGKEPLKESLEKQVAEQVEQQLEKVEKVKNEQQVEFQMNDQVKVEQFEQEREQSKEMVVEQMLEEELLKKMEAQKQQEIVEAKQELKVETQNQSDEVKKQQQQLEDHETQLQRKDKKKEEEAEEQLQEEEAEEPQQKLDLVQEKVTMNEQQHLQKLEQNQLEQFQQKQVAAGAEEQQKEAKEGQHVQGETEEQKIPTSQEQQKRLKQAIPQQVKTIENLKAAESNRLTEFEQKTEAISTLKIEPLKQDEKEKEKEEKDTQLAEPMEESNKRLTDMTADSSRQRANEANNVTRIDAANAAVVAASKDEGYDEQQQQQQQQKVQQKLSKKSDIQTDNDGQANGINSVPLQENLPHSVAAQPAPKLKLKRKQTQTKTKTKKKPNETDTKPTLSSQSIRMSTTPAAQANTPTRSTVKAPVKESPEISSTQDIRRPIQDAQQLHKGAKGGAGKGKLKRRPSEQEIETTTNWWQILPYAEIRKFLNTIYDSIAYEDDDERSAQRM